VSFLSTLPIESHIETKQFLTDGFVFGDSCGNKSNNFSMIVISLIIKSGKRSARSPIVS